MTAHQQLSVIIRNRAKIIRNRAKLMSVLELVPDNSVLSLAIEDSLMLLQLISVRSSEGSGPDQANARGMRLRDSSLVRGS